MYIFIQIYLYVCTPKILLYSQTIIVVLGCFLELEGNYIADDTTHF